MREDKLWETVAMGDILALQGKAGGGAFSLGFSLGVPAFSLLVRYVCLA